MKLPKRESAKAFKTKEVNMPRHFPKGLDNRMRDQDGQIRQKRSDTHISTLREEYGPDFAKGYRSDAHLGTVLQKEGADSLSELIKKPQ